MNKNIFIDKNKIYRLLIPTTIAFLGFLILPLYFAVEFNFFYKFSVFKIIGLTIYFFFMMKWIQELILYYKLAMQKDPLVQINDNGLTFNRDNKTIYIPWNLVLKSRIFFYS